MTAPAFGKSRPGRNYYTELAKAIPEDCIILTLACGKYRFNKLDFGKIGGLGPHAYRALTEHLLASGMDVIG